MQPVFCLVPDTRCGPIEYLGGDFLAPVRGQAMQKEGLWVCKLHEARVDRVSLECVLSLIRLRFLSHARPYVGRDDMCSSGCLSCVCDYANAATFRMSQDFGARFMPFWAGENELEPNQARGMYPRMRNVVAVS